MSSHICSVSCSFQSMKGGGSKRFKKVIRIVRRYWETLGDCYKFRMVLLQGRGKATSHTFSYIKFKHGGRRRDCFSLL